MKTQSITKEDVLHFLAKDMKEAHRVGTVEAIEDLFCHCPCTGFLLKNGCFLTPQCFVRFHSEIESQEWIPSKDFHVIELCHDPKRVHCKIHFEWKGFDKRVSKHFQASCVNRYIFGRKENGDLCIVSFQEKSRYYLSGSHDPVQEFEKECEGK